MLVTKLRSVGGSVMFAIPKAILDGLDLKADTAVGLSIEGGKLVVDPDPKKRPALAELLARCRPELPRTGEDVAWLYDPPLGREQV
jgi:antitoxin ChpS